MVRYLAREAAGEGGYRVNGLAREGGGEKIEEQEGGRGEEKRKEGGKRKEKEEVLKLLDPRSRKPTRRDATKRSG